LPPAERRRAFEAGLAAYANGDYFEAHERWEPAWMGTDDLAERELIQGLIKLAAAFVHKVRGNPKGVEKNLRGARARIETGVAAGAALGIDAAAVLAAIDEWLAAPGAVLATPRLRSGRGPRARACGAATSRRSAGGG
jgi:predicted metal-dependent hydrolase